MRLVLDASAALAWIFERADAHETAVADRLFDVIAERETWVPALWHTEIANALLVAERRGLVREALVMDFIHRLSRLPIATDDVSVSSRKELVLVLGREHQLSAYDATYLELALRLGASLATFDGKLAAAMQQAGGEVYGSLP